MACVEKQKIF